MQLPGTTLSNLRKGVCASVEERSGKRHGWPEFAQTRLPEGRAEVCGPERIQRPRHVSCRWGDILGQGQAEGSDDQRLDNHGELPCLCLSDGRVCLARLVEISNNGFRGSERLSWRRHLCASTRSQNCSPTRSPHATLRVP